MVTLLEALTAKNLSFDTSRVPNGPNTDSDAAEEPEHWVPWEDFTYGNLTSIFSEELKAHYRGPTPSDALPQDTTICNEHTLEIALHRFLMPTVNHCLKKAPGGPHYGSGSRISLPRAKPDWSCITNGYDYNCVPGDTKLSAKFTPDMVANNFTEWQKVVGQVMAYQIISPSRYGLIITDDFLVVMRLSREGVDDGIAAGRSRRAGESRVQSYQQNADDSYNTTASFVDDNRKSWEFNPPEYAVVRWNEYGPKKMTIKLALWCLAMLALVDGSSIGYSYPALNSWHEKDYVYTHTRNTTGAAKRHSGRRGITPSSDPGATEGRSTHSSAGETSQQFVQGESSASGGAGYEYAYDYGAAYEYDNDDGEGEEEDEPKGGQEGEQEQEGKGKEKEIAHDEGSDTDTIVAGLKEVRVIIKKRMMKRTLYFVNSRGHEVDTRRSDWQKVDGRYELRTKRHLYVTRRFPE